MSTNPQLFSRKELMAHKLMQTQNDLKAANEQITALELELAELRAKVRAPEEPDLRRALDTAGPFAAWGSSLEDLRRVIVRLCDRQEHLDEMLSRIWDRLDGGKA